MSDRRVETLPEGFIRVEETCGTCGEEVAWSQIVIADDGRSLIGLCGCSGRIHRFLLGQKDRPVDRRGRRL